MDYTFRYLNKNKWLVSKEFADGRASFQSAVLAFSGKTENN
jgi:hypothetical protein